MMLKLNVDDRQHNKSHFFFDTTRCILFDEKGFYALDLESHPMRRTEPYVPTDPNWTGDYMIKKLAIEPKEIQSQYCIRQCHLLINGHSLNAGRHADKFQYYLDNFLLDPAPKHDMSWLETVDSTFFYNFPYFYAVIFFLTGKTITGMEQEAVA